jgi:hypothetical protein
MTKAQKQKAKLAEQRLEAMRAAGMLPTAGQEEESEAPQPKKVVYDNRRKGRDKDHGKTSQQQEKQHAKDKENDDEDDAQEDWEDEEKDTENELKEQDKLGGSISPKEPESSAQNAIEDDEEEEDWEGQADDDSGEEWDAGSDDDKFDDLAARLKKVTANNDDDEDLIQKEKVAEQERLRQIGLERAERDRIEAEKMAKLREIENERSRQEQILARKREEGKRKRLEQEKVNLEARSRDDLRCPIVVIMGTFSESWW